ncbi:unnamed protein product [Gadus morhua 'NCC']
MVRKRQEERQEGDQETLCGDSSSPPGEQRPALVSTSSQKKERLRQVVIRWMETNEEANDPDQGQTPPGRGRTPPDRGRTAPDRGRTAPDRDQTAPDRGQTAPDQDQTAPDHGQTAPDRGQTAPDHGQTAPNRGQTAPDQEKTPDEPAERALRKDLSQVTGNMRTRLRGLRELWAETLTIALLDQEEEKPLGRPSGLNPVPGQTAPDHGQTAPDRGQTAPDRGQTAPDRGQTAPDHGQTAPDRDQTAPDHGQTAPNQGQTPPDQDQTPPDQGQTPDEPADRALRKDLSQVTGNTRTRLRGLRELWAETLTIALLDQEEEKPLGRPSGLNPFPGQTAPDQGQTAPDHDQTPPDRAERALRKDLSQVTGNTRTRLRGLRELWAETRTIALLDQEKEKPLGRHSGLIPVPGQTAPDRGQTAPDQGQTAPDRVQTAPDQGQTAPDQDKTDQKEKPLGRPSGLNPLGDIKTATQQAEGKGLRPWMHVL